MALKFIFHFTLSIFVFSDTKTTTGSHRGLGLQMNSKMNLKEEDFDLLMMVDDYIDPCLRIVQTSFNNYTAVSITSIGPTGSQKKCSFSTT